MSSVLVYEQFGLGIITPLTAVLYVLSPYFALPMLCISWNGEQKNEGGEPSSVAARASDAVEKRRKDKMLIARMLDMDEPFMTEKVHDSS